MHGIGKSEDGRVRAVLTEQQVGADSEPTLRDIQDALNAVYGTDFGIHDATWISRFTDMTRQAAAYRDRRVLLAGDAAHVHSPMGGQGLNLGVQDAVNLGWKLAQVIRRTSPRNPARHVSRRAASGRRACVAQQHGAGCAAAPGRSDEMSRRPRRRIPEH